MTRLDFRFSGPAKQEIREILRFSMNRFGPAAARRYRLLIGQAARDLTESPARIGTSVDGFRVHYHLHYSRNRAPGEKVREPRHYLVARVDGTMLTILAIIHESMVDGAARRIEEGEGG